MFRKLVNLDPLSVNNMDGILGALFDRPRHAAGKAGGTTAAVMYQTRSEGSKGAKTACAKVPEISAFFPKIQIEAKL